MNYYNIVNIITNVIIKKTLLTNILVYPCVKVTRHFRHARLYMPSTQKYPGCITRDVGMTTTRICPTWNSESVCVDCILCRENEERPDTFTLVKPDLQRRAPLDRVRDSLNRFQVSQAVNG